MCNSVSRVPSNLPRGLRLESSQKEAKNLPWRVWKGATQRHHHAEFEGQFGRAARTMVYGDQ